MTTILGESVATQEQAIKFAVGKGAGNAWSWLAAVYYELAPKIGVRADVAWAQACKETGYGKFGRAVTPAHHNPCGLKVPDPAGKADNDPEAHQRFPTWDVGIRAHLEHLALYAGAPGFPLAYTKLSPTRWTGATADPRHFSYLWGTTPALEDMGGGRWAPASDYGLSIVKDYLNPMIGVDT